MQAPKALDTIGAPAGRLRQEPWPRAPGLGLHAPGAPAVVAAAARVGPPPHVAAGRTLEARRPPRPSRSPAPCPRARPTAGKNLQAQYERWQPRAKYRMHLDPTTEDVKKLAISCRRTAKARARLPRAVLGRDSCTPARARELVRGTMVGAVVQPACLFAC